MRLVPSAESTAVSGRLCSFTVFILGACASAPSPSAQPPRQPPPTECGNAVLHELFEKELAAAQAEPEPEKRAAAVCKVAHDWHIEDCSNVTADSLNLP